MMTEKMKNKGIDCSINLTFKVAKLTKNIFNHHFTDNLSSLIKSMYE